MKKKFEGIDWSAPAATATEPQPPVSKPNAATAPGAEFQRVADTRSQMLKENEALKDQAKSWEGAVPTRKIPTNLIVHSKYANRHEDSFEGVEFAELREEIKNAGGNVQPIKVRKIEGGKFEVIFGHRRLEACKQNKLDVLAIVEDMDDQALFVEMDRENRNRKNLAPWEQGMSYCTALEDGLFSSNGKMAEALGVDVGNLGKAISLAELPAEIVAAFASPLDLQYRWAKPLREAVQKNPKACFAIAKKLASSSPKLKAAAVFAALTNANADDPASTQKSSKALEIKVSNKSVATITLGKKGATEVYFSSALSDEKANALSEFIRQLMKE